MGCNKSGGAGVRTHTGRSTFKQCQIPLSVSGDAVIELLFLTLQLYMYKNALQKTCTNSACFFSSPPFVHETVHAKKGMYKDQCAEYGKNIRMHHAVIEDGK